LKKLLITSFTLLSLSGYSQCLQSEIIIDNFSGPACTVSLVNADPLNTVMQTECTGRSGSISGAADIWIQKNSPAAGGSATTIGYSGFNNFDTGPGAGLISTFSITWDGTDSNTNPDYPNLTGPILLDFTNRTIKFTASVDDIGAGNSVTFIGSVWDAAGNMSTATLVLSGARAQSTSEVLNLGAFTGTADLTDIRAIQLKQTTTQGGMDLTIEKVAAVCKDVNLPVTLKEFKGSYAEKIIDLSWSTTAETNSDRFEIERSFTGKGFEKIGTVQAKGQSELNYHFKYNQLLSSTTFFRLKMVDKDETYAYSRLVVLKPNPDDAQLLVAFPTVFNNSLTVSLSVVIPGDIAIRILDINGTIRNQKIAKVVSGTNEVEINSLGSLSSGMYIVQVETEAGIHSRKVIKQ